MFKTTDENDHVFSTEVSIKSTSSYNFLTYGANKLGDLCPHLFLQYTHPSTHCSVDFNVFINDLKKPFIL